MKIFKVFLVVLLFLSIPFKIAGADDLNRDLIIAAKNGDTDTVISCLAKGADVNTKHKKGYTALFFAAAEGHTDTVQALLAQGADVNAKEYEDNSTVLMAAALYGHTDTVQALLAQGADVNAKDNYGITALGRAKVWGHVEIIRMLKQAGAK